MELILVSIGIIMCPVVVVYWFLMRRTDAPSRVMELSELEAEGMTPQQARAEQRAQRRDLREHSYAKGYSTRTGVIVGRFFRSAKRIR